MDRPWLVFLHGINASTKDAWRDPLNDAITRAGCEPFPDEQVIAPDYRAALRGEIPGAQPTRDVWKRPPKDEWRRATTEYLTRMALLEKRLRPLSREAPPWVKSVVLDKVPPFPKLIDEASNYAHSAKVRAAVHDIVLTSLEAVPAGSQIVILAHSLGTVVAADVIKKLPGHLHVKGLVTIGSPLGGISEFRSHSLDDYPLDRLHAWVNIFDPRDIVTGGNGVSQYHPWAIDIPILLPDWLFPAVIHQHGAQFYCTHGAVAMAVTGALMSSEVATRDARPGACVRGLELPLLQSLYLRELAKRLPADEPDRVARLERARRFTAATHASAAAVISDKNPGTARLAEGEFLQRPDTYIRGAWDDRTVLALAIMLASGAPAHPFEIEAKPDTEQRRLALVSTLSLIREHSSGPTDVDIVDAVFAKRAEISDLLFPGRSWAPAALLTAGVVTLAATGVGLAFAVPAGLVGAAVMTSTLAAFGPGGMVGGMAALAALAGAGSAMAAAGAALGAAGATRTMPDLLTNALDEAIDSTDAESLRNLLASLLTLVAAQERLEFPSQRDQMLFAFINAQARVAEQIAAHESIDPKSDAAKAAKEMLTLLVKACHWLRGEPKPDSAQARQWNKNSTAFGQALNGQSQPLKEVLAGPGLRISGSPGLTKPEQ